MSAQVSEPTPAEQGQGGQTERDLNKSGGLRDDEDIGRSKQRGCHLRVPGSDEENGVGGRRPRWNVEISQWSLAHCNVRIPFPAHQWNNTSTEESLPME